MKKLNIVLSFVNWLPTLNAQIQNEHCYIKTKIEHTGPLPNENAWTTDEINIVVTYLVQKTPRDPLLVVRVWCVVYVLSLTQKNEGTGEKARHQAEQHLWRSWESALPLELGQKWQDACIRLLKGDSLLFLRTPTRCLHRGNIFYGIVWSKLGIFCYSEPCGRRGKPSIARHHLSRKLYKRHLSRSPPWPPDCGTLMACTTFRLSTSATSLANWVYCSYAAGSVTARASTASALIFAWNAWVIKFHVSHGAGLGNGCWTFQNVVVA